MKNTDRLIDYLRSNNVFKQFYESGMTPGEIKKLIVDSLCESGTSYNAPVKKKVDSDKL